ncbi:MAG TPA: hypothetical protein VKV27_08835 [Solirubrobacteraceae bacterium]|nr:hypothetical protein [Solirubrobacteraceae bacterium]
MEVAWLHRARWRWRGALLWPTFIVAAPADAVIAHLWPAVGSAESLGSGLLVGLVASLLAVVVGSPALGAALRLLRPGLPVAIARNYGGAIAVSLVTATLVALGLAHRDAIARSDALLRDALARAVAFIGFRAPAEFRSNAARPDVLVIQPDAIYRVCVPGREDGRWYCVVVRPQVGGSQGGVVFAGSEPNELLAQGGY